MVLIYLVAGQSVAQNSLDILTLSGRYGFHKSYESTFPAKATETGALANLRFGFTIGKNSIWYANLTYTYSQVTNDISIPDSIADPINLNAFILQTGLVQRINDSNAIQIPLAPRYMSDFKNTAGSGSHFQMGLIAQYEKKYHEGLMLRCGGKYNQEFGGPLLVPLIDVNWQISDRSSITGLFPIMGSTTIRSTRTLPRVSAILGLLPPTALGTWPIRVITWNERALT
jgi:hypothetical protein